jgi:short subunit dehydrogenase-like uncharacterized protein
MLALHEELSYHETVMRWMLYGANGYTGELIAGEAARRGLRPILAGRREDAVRAVAERLGLEHAVFALDDPAETAKRLDGISVLLLCAGPFSATSAPALEACLRAKCGYLDITGEIDVFEACFARGDEATARGIVVMPGVGFDVVPSDCLAAALAETTRGAVELELAFAGLDSISGGTMKTAIEGIGKGGMVRRGGRLERVPIGWKKIDVPFRDKTRSAVSIPWGDIATAYRSTGIPDITVYSAMAPAQARILPFVRVMAPLLRIGAVQRFAKARVKVRGPDEAHREKLRGHLWGRVRAADGRTREATLEVPDSYDLTVTSSLEIVERVIAGQVAPGVTTPSQAFGWRFITELPGCDLRVL